VSADSISPLVRGSIVINTPLFRNHVFNSILIRHPTFQSPFRLFCPFPPKLRKLQQWKLLYILVPPIHRHLQPLHMIFHLFIFTQFPLIHILQTRQWNNLLPVTPDIVPSRHPNRQARKLSETALNSFSKRLPRPPMITRVQIGRCSATSLAGCVVEENMTGFMQQRAQNIQNPVDIVWRMSRRHLNTVSETAPASHF
jgi:hypothetical protein